MVARAPTSNEVPDPHYAGPLTIGHTAGQLRTLTEAYRVVDRWDGYTPAAASVAQSGRLYLTPGPSPKWYTNFDVTLTGLPGDEVVSIAGEPVDASCGQQLYVGGTPHPIVDGRVTLRVGMNFRLSALSCSRLRLPLRVRYSDAAADLRLVTVDLGRVTIRKAVLVERTRQLLDAGLLSFKRYDVSGTCSGSVDSTAVGSITIDGDIAFRVHDELLGTRCLWVLEQSGPGKAVLRDDGWAITGFGWTEPTSTSRCDVQMEGGRSEWGMYSFDRGEVYMGRWTRAFAPDSLMNVALDCISTAQQAVIIGIPKDAPHDLTVRVDWVSFAAPVSAAGWEDLKR